jgi:hypothetical protein
MHGVGRRYGTAERVTLTNLLDHLPKTNDPGCSAGFAHGLPIALGPEIERLGPKGAAADCHRATTRYQRYSCIHGLGHAYARQFNDFVDPALASCARLDAAAACVRGLRVPTYALAPFTPKLALIRACAGVRSAQRACYFWLGKALNVVTDGAFASCGCTQLRYAATRATCTRGARAYEGALETFS